MGDISFLSDKNDNSNKNDTDVSSMKWSMPTGSEKKESSSGGRFFSFGKKKDNTISKEQLEAERAQVINALNSHEEKPSLFSFFGGGKKKKDLGVDFEADFKEDQKHYDNKIDRALGQATSLSSTSFSVPIDPPTEMKKNLASGGTDDIASYRTTLFDRLIDRWLKKKTAEEIGEEVIGSEVEASAVTSEITPSPEIKTEDNSAKGNEASVEKIIPVKKKDEKILSDSDVLETNLMEGESISFFDWQKNSTTLGIFVVMAVVVIGIAYAGLVIYGEEKAKSAVWVNSEIDNLKNQIAVAQEGTEEFAPQEKKIKLVTSLLSKHIYWTNFFGFLEKYTIADVYYGSFSGDSKGKYTLSARAKNFNNLTEQLKVFRDEKKYVTQVNISGGKLTASDEDKSTGVDFNLDITFKQDVFYK